MAAAAGMTAEAFAGRHVVRVEGRWSLRERPDGRCSLLEGLNDCTIYRARPEQCRTFPFWPSILAGGEGLRRAAAVCPGLEILDPAGPKGSEGPEGPEAR